MLETPYRSILLHSSNFLGFRLQSLSKRFNDSLGKFRRIDVSVDLCDLYRRVQVFLERIDKNLIGRRVVKSPPSTLREEKPFVGMMNLTNFL